MFKTPEICLKFTFEPDVLQFFLRDLFSLLLDPVLMSQAIQNPSINFHHAWQR